MIRPEESVLSDCCLDPLGHRVQSASSYIKGGPGERMPGHVRHSHAIPAAAAVVPHRSTHMDGRADGLAWHSISSALSWELPLAEDQGLGMWTLDAFLLYDFHVFGIKVKAGIVIFFWGGGL